MSGSKTTKKAQRKGPSASATLFEIGTKKHGNDGRMWKIVSYNGIKRWVAPKKSNPNSKRNTRSNPSTKLSKRKSPIESATLFPVGTKKLGLDGKQWIITETSTGIKRWVPYDLDTSVIRYRDDTITFFDVDKIIPKLKLGRIKKAGYLDITTNKIGVGELLFNELPAPKGRYNIYYYMGSLIAVHENGVLDGQKFTITKYTADCDIGSFAFNDAGYIKKYEQPKKRRKKSLLFPYFNTGIFFKPDRSVYDHVYVYEADLDINQGNPDADKSNPIAIFADNRFGDGSFPIYQGKNAFWIMSEDVHSAMFELVR
jgi:hypothetical protein